MRIFPFFAKKRFLIFLLMAKLKLNYQRNGDGDNLNWPFYQVDLFIYEARKQNISADDIEGGGAMLNRASPKIFVIRMGSNSMPAGVSGFLLVSFCFCR